MKPGRGGYRQGVDREAGTLSATDTEQGGGIVFLDYVYDGEIVDVYGSVEDAEAERDSFRKMRVVWTPEDWTLIPEATA